MESSDCVIHAPHRRSRKQQEQHQEKQFAALWDPALLTLLKLLLLPFLLEYLFQTREVAQELGLLVLGAFVRRKYFRLFLVLGVGLVFV